MSAHADSTARWKGALAAAFVVGSLGTLHLIGGRLAAPPVGSLHGLVEWTNQTDPVTASFAILRLVGLGAGWYLVGSAALQFLAQASRIGPLQGAADVLSIPAVRRAVSALLGLTITIGSTAQRPVPDAGQTTIERIGDPAGSATLRRLPDAEVIVRAGDDDTDTAVLTRLPPESPGQTDAPQPPVAPPSVWTISCGDHPWLVAEEVLTNAWQRPPTDDETAGYWRDLLTLNRLPNPDLVFVGQTLSLPPVPDAPHG